MAVSFAASACFAPAFSDAIDPVQMLADVTLIDAQCRSMNASFGPVLRYAAEHGLHPVDIMPLGGRRAEFQAAYTRRLNTTSPEELCGQLARQYDQEFPGVFTAR